jgi:hypothetical protein
MEAVVAVVAEVAGAATGVEEVVVPVEVTAINQTMDRTPIRMVEVEVAADADAEDEVPHAGLGGLLPPRLRGVEEAEMQPPPSSMMVRL